MNPFIATVDQDCELSDAAIEALAVLLVDAAESQTPEKPNEPKQISGE